MKNQYKTKTINKIPLYCIECGTRFWDTSKISNNCDACESPICENCLDSLRLCEYCLYDSIVHEESGLFV